MNADEVDHPEGESALLHFVLESLLEKRRAERCENLQMFDFDGLYTTCVRNQKTNKDRIIVLDLSQQKTELLLPTIRTLYPI